MELLHLVSYFFGAAFLAAGVICARLLGPLHGGDLSKRS